MSYGTEEEQAGLADEASEIQTPSPGYGAIGSELQRLEWATLAQQHINAMGRDGLMAALSHLLGQAEMATILGIGRWERLPEMITKALDYGKEAQR